MNVRSLGEITTNKNKFATNVAKISNVHPDSLQ